MSSCANHSTSKCKIDALSLKGPYWPYLLFVEGVLPEHRQTAGDVDMMPRHQSAAEQHGNYTQQLQHLDDGWLLDRVAPTFVPCAHPNCRKQTRKVVLPEA